MKRKPTNILTIIGIIVTLAFVSLGFKECEKLPPQAYKHKMPEAVKKAGKNPNGTVQIWRNTTQQTPKGIRVYSESGITPAQLDLIDAGLTETLDNARAEGYNQHQASYQYNWYGVFIYKNCQPSPESRTPSFLVRGDVYETTIWDAHFSIGFRPPIIEPVPGFPEHPPRTRYSMPDGRGVVYAAEMLLQFNDAAGDMLVCADTSLLPNAVKYGAEHLKISREDADYFLATMVHGPPHPLLPRPTGFVPSEASLRIAEDLIEAGQLTRVKGMIDGEKIPIQTK